MHNSQTSDSTKAHHRACHAVLPWLAHIVSALLSTRLWAARKEGGGSGKTFHSSSTIVTTVLSERSRVHAFFKCLTKRNRASHHLWMFFIPVLDTLAWVIDGQIEKRRICKQEFCACFFFFFFNLLQNTSHNSYNCSSIRNGRTHSMRCSYCFITTTRDTEFIAKPGTLWGWGIPSSEL